MNIVTIILVALMFGSSVYLFPQLPAQIPMHWNALGQIDNYMPKNIAVWYLPVLTGLMVISFYFAPLLDPKKEKYKLFQHEWQIMQIGITGFMAYIHFMILYLTFHPEVAMMPLMFVGLGALFILIGNYMSKIRQNYFIGVKVPWTLSSEDNWNKTHRFASWCFVIAGIFTLAEAFFVWQAPVIIFGSIMLAAFLPMIYSFLLYKKRVHAMKFVYLGILGIIVILALVRGMSGEDEWMCRDGQWVQHGKPSSPMPIEACK